MVLTSVTPGEILALIAASPPWFPAQYAKAAGVPRDALDAVITRLWESQLIYARDWQRGLGQGYDLTPEGERAARDPAVLARALAGPRIDDSRERPALTTYDRGERARDAFLNPKRAIVTQTLIFLNVLVFFIGFIVAWRSGNGRMAFIKGEDVTTLLKLGAITGDGLLNGEWWRLITTNFVHIGLVHLVLNMYCLGMIGRFAEDLWGHWRYTVIYLVSGICGNTLAMLIAPNTLVAGASGATWGLMVSLGVWLFLYHQHFDAKVVKEFARYLGLSLLICGAVSFLPRVSWQCHMGGAVGGFTMAFLLELIRPGYRRRTIAGIIGSILFPLAVLGALALVMNNSSTWQPLRHRHALQMRAQFYQSLQPELNEVGPGAATGVMVALEKSKLNVLRFGKIIDDSKTLLHKAEELRASVADIDSEPAVRVRAYLDDFISFNRGVIAFLEADSDDLQALVDAKRRLDERWSELYKTP